MVTSMSTVPTRHEAWCDVAAHDAGNAVEPGPCSSRAVTVERVSVWLVEDGRSDLAAVAVDTAFGAVLTPSDARELAAHLVALADVAQGQPPCPPWCRQSHSGQDLMRGERDHSCTVLDDDAASIAVSRLDRRGDDWSWTLGQPRVFCRSELNLSGEQTQRVAAAMGTAQHLAEDAAGSGPVGS
jgi:hypothetical protein